MSNINNTSANLYRAGSLAGPAARRLSQEQFAEAVEESEEPVCADDQDSRTCVSKSQS